MSSTEVRHEHTPPVGVRWHPYADLFPWIEGRAFDELVEDVRKNGVIEPIVFLGEFVLDGRNRYMAARKLGIEYPRVEYEGDDPLGFVIAKNLARRHLTEAQWFDLQRLQPDAGVAILTLDNSASPGFDQPAPKR